MKELKPEDRLIVAPDARPGEAYPLFPEERNCRSRIREKVLILADRLKGTGVYFKVNSVLRAVGYDLIDEIHGRGLRVFADLKLFDIGGTLEIDGAFLKEANPELLTVSCAAGVAGMKAVKDRLPNAEVLGVTVLTSLPTEECQKIHGHAGMAGAVGRSLAQLAKSACLDGIVCSPAEVSPIRDMIGPSMSINTPAIRPAWANVIGDDQNKDRVMTPKEAIRAGADRIIVGRPIFQARDPYDAVMRVLEEIAYTQ